MIDFDIKITKILCESIRKEIDCGRCSSDIYLKIKHYFCADALLEYGLVSGILMPDEFSDFKKDLLILHRHICGHSDVIKNSKLSFFLDGGGN